MNQSIVVEVKNVYGNELIYPIDDTAHAFAQLIGKKTFSTQDIARIKKLGFVVNVAQVVL